MHSSRDNRRPKSIVAAVGLLAATIALPWLQAETVMLTARWQWDATQSVVALSGDLKTLVVAEGQVASVKHFYCHIERSAPYGTQIEPDLPVKIRIEFPAFIAQYSILDIHGGQPSVGMNTTPRTGIGLPSVVGPATILLVPTSPGMTQYAGGWSFCTVEVEGTADVRPVEPAGAGGKTVTIGLRSSDDVNGPWQPAELGSQEIADGERFFRLDIKEEE
ncbi:MAG: hypothetical protein H6827_10880 [Planctomycetes bacterium]|nr:hypothetical protein [Planctomycetota bacterium]